MKTPKPGIEIYYGGGVLRHGDPVPKSIEEDVSPDSIENYVAPSEEAPVDDVTEPTPSGTLTAPAELSEEAPVDDVTEPVAVVEDVSDAPEIELDESEGS